ncbi:MAG TPA: FAD-binding oxidoreductase [Gemmataceae bacterium]|nr:FAD-binding oxidoreductase [Gemmataceae bacterium]
MEPLTCLIDDFGPLPVVPPSSVAEMGDLVRRAVAEGQAIYPVGGRTMLDYGLPPTRPGLVVDLRRLDRVIDYPARDMTITVQAGITVARLQEVLAGENQRLPVDVPCAEQATLGGALATNVSGPRRYGFGTLRDYVIGISVVNDEGQEVKAGGRVVKNVAGYDLCKLYIGALGTLGIISQVTLKLRPRPEEQALLTLGCSADDLEPLLDLLHHSRTRPVCLDVLNAAAVRVLNQRAGGLLPEAPWVVVVGFEDNRQSVAWQMQQLIQELPANLTPGLEARVGAASGPLWQALVEFPARPEARFIFKANLLPRAVAAFCRRAAALSLIPHGGERDAGLLLQAHAGSGIVIGQADDLTPGNAATMLKELQEAAGEEGNVVVRRCPAAWKPGLPIWGRPRGDAWLMRQVKDKLDPRRLFNPGRFIDGI